MPIKKARHKVPGQKNIKEGLRPLCMYESSQGLEGLTTEKLAIKSQLDCHKKVALS